MSELLPKIARIARLLSQEDGRSDHANAARRLQKTDVSETLTTFAARKAYVDSHATVVGGNTIVTDDVSTSVTILGLTNITLLYDDIVWFCAFSAQYVDFCLYGSCEIKHLRPAKVPATQENWEVGENPTLPPQR